MKIGVMSDTHGHLDLMRQAASKMMDKYGVSALIHLGDDSADADELNLRSIQIYSVPGIYEARYKNPDIANRLIKEFEDVPFLLTHTPTREACDLEGDIDPIEAMEDGDVKVVLHGHSHAWRVVEEKGAIVINPGHLVPKDHSASKGNEPTFAILDVTPKKLDVKIVSLGEDLLMERTFFFDV